MIVVVLGVVGYSAINGNFPLQTTLNMFTVYSRPCVFLEIVMKKLSFDCIFKIMIKNIIEVGLYIFWRETTQRIQLAYQISLEVGIF